MIGTSAASAGTFQVQSLQLLMLNICLLEIVLKLCWLMSPHVFQHY